MYYPNDTLRDYQQEMKLRLFEEWEFHRNVMVQMPTGTGKTHLLAAIVREFLRGSGSRVWIVAHRRELVDQIEETVSRHGMSKEDGRVRVMSIQWLRLLREFLSTVPYCDNTNYEGHYSNCSTSSFPCSGCMSMWKCVSRTLFPQWIASGEGRDLF